MSAANLAEGHTMITIGVDPHKHTHTAVAVNHRHQVVDKLELDNDRHAVTRLRRWARRWPDRR